MIKDFLTKRKRNHLATEMGLRFSRATLTSARRKLDATNPTSWEFAGFCQNQEDGISDYLLSQLKQKNRYFIEIGSSNGLENNTAWLAFGLKYSGLMVEGSEALVRDAQTHLRPYNWGVKYLPLFVTQSTAQNIVDAALFKDPDFFSLDIDGNDYYILKTMMTQGLRPKIIVVEYNAAFGPDAALTIPYDDRFSYQKAHASECYFGVSISAWRQLLEAAGYAFVTVESNGVNAFFIDKACFEPHFISALKGLAFAENFALRRKHGLGWETHFQLVKDMPYVRL
ncbi:MAG: hypothetical protein AB7F28_04020 [Candidatus Margulisiibacteriota bacterium]